MVGSEEDFWSSIINQLNEFQDVEVSGERTTGVEFEARGKGGANFLIAKGEAEAGTSFAKERTESTTHKRTLPSRVSVLKALGSSDRALVIDDFHYLSKELQGELIRALKQPIFDGLPVVIIAIPHRRYDAVKVEREMTGRILPVDIPAWSERELAYIPENGFPLLDATISPKLVQDLSAQSIGSPHLMQEFCRAICRAHQVSTSFGNWSADLAPDEMERIFKDTAETIGRPIFEKLARSTTTH